MADVASKVATIRNAKYGNEVREGIASGIENINTEVISTTGRQTTLEGTQGILQSQFSDVVTNATATDPSSVEIVAARLGEVDLPTKIGQIDSSLAGNVQELNLKAPQTDITNVNNRINNIIATPTTVSEQEIMDARRGKASLGSKIIEMDTIQLKQQKRLITTAYIYSPTSVDGYYTPDIQEKMESQRIYFRLRDNAHSISLKPEDGGAGFPGANWGELKVLLAGNLITYNGLEYINIPQGSALVINYETMVFEVVSRIAIKSVKHKILLLNALGIVVSGESMNWFRSKYKVDNNSLPMAIIEPQHLSSDTLSLINDSVDVLSVPLDIKAEYDSVVYDSFGKSLGGDSLSFAFITDTHGEGATYQNTLSHLNIINKIEKYGKLDFLAHGGDIINGMLADKSVALTNLMEYAKVLNSKIPSLILHGNHDDNSYYNKVTPLESTTISEQEWFNYVLKGCDNVHDTLNLTSKYFLKDFDKQKIRVICLDAADYPIVNNAGVLKWSGSNGWGFGNRQIHWLAEEALELGMKTDYHILVISHIGTRDELQNTDRITPYNSTLIEGILKAFAMGTSYTGNTVAEEWSTTITHDYTTQGIQTIIGMVYGHTHRDLITSPSDVSWSYISSIGSFTPLSGDFDIFTINKSERKVYTTRMGTGADRTFTY